NIWKYSLTPYREHLYEYPPATIPLVSLPLALDNAGFGYYYLNYRLLVFLIEILVFGLLLYYAIRTKAGTKTLILALAFYSVCGIVAKDYWYEGLDLLFISAFVVGILARELLKKHPFWGAYAQWVGFWLSVGIKYMTAPLMLPLLVMRRHSLKTELVACGLGFLTIWSIPLALYRSSLAVMFVFHAQRPLKYGALGTTIIKTINDFTG